MHSIMCFRSVRSACWPPHQCNQCRSTCRPSPSCAFYFCTSEQESLCIPPISHHHRNQRLCVPVCAFHPPAIHGCNQCVCVQHLRQQPQFTVCSNCHNQVLSISTPVNENHFCRPHNRQPDRNQCLWIPWCAFHYVLPFCSFCLPAITPMQSVPVKPQFKVCSTCRPSPSYAFSFCTSEQESLCIPPISHHHRNQCLCVPVCAFHPPAIHRCNQCVCVQHPHQQPQFTVCSTCHNQKLCFLFLCQ